MGNVHGTLATGGLGQGSHGHTARGRPEIGIERAMRVWRAPSFHPPLEVALVPSWLSRTASPADRHHEDRGMFPCQDPLREANDPSLIALETRRSGRSLISSESPLRPESRTESAMREVHGTLATGGLG